MGQKDDLIKGLGGILKTSLDAAVQASVIEAQKKQAEENARYELLANALQYGVNAAMKKNGKKEEPPVKKASSKKKAPPLEKPKSHAEKNPKPSRKTQPRKKAAPPVKQEQAETPQEKMRQGGRESMNDSGKSTWPDGVMPWEILKDYRWEASGEGEGVRRLNVFPVRREHIRNVLPREDIQKAMADIGNSLTAFFKNAMDCDMPIAKVMEAPVLLSLPLHLMIEDPDRGRHTVRDAYFSWGKNNITTGVLPDSLRQSVLDRTWVLPSTEQGVRLFKGLHPWNAEAGEISGVSVYNQSTKAPHYFYLPYESIESFNGSYHRNVMDLYVVNYVDTTALLGTLLDKSWTVQIGERNTGDFPWWGLLCRLYQMDMIRLSLTSDNEIRVSAREDELLEALGEDGIPGAEVLFRRRDITVGSPALYEQARRELLSRDTLRANITEYEDRWLTDPNGGLWELWKPDMPEYAMMAVPEPVYARDPRLDIADGVVGIDFGTKSTVVVSMSGTDRIQPERIGMGRVEKELRPEDYENPTVMEFCDIQGFLEAYRRREGRPLTRWRDLAVSHTAVLDWRNNTDTGAYSAFFGELKQWAGERARRVRIRDMAGREIELRPYLELGEEDLDPIELYAYYIGLYINNMHTGRVFLEYLLSFPVTYSREVRDHIRESFRRGLRRSLPQTLLEDEELAGAPYVDEGSGEPAAYAVCALEEYRFRPRGKEEVHYAVFDFGGGTTDFDFGVWRAADKGDRREKKYNYVITHFKDGGDRYLGGEVLLERMAFHVFRQNREKLREKGIVFTLPPECHLPGGEFLLSDSQEARSNTRTMMEQLRPLWERTEEYAKKYQDGHLPGVGLFDRHGEKVDVDLDVSQEELEALLRSRIDEGVTKFLYALDAAFEGDESFRERAEKVHIFLAGNSSKSPILWEVFESRLQEQTERIRERYRERGDDEAAEREFFELFPALGTPQAEEMQSIRGVRTEEPPEGWLERPTGKTGVAIGLVRSRSGGKIKVVDEIPREDEIRFKYYVGDEDADGFFQALLERDTPFLKWVELCSADSIRFGFYFTTSPQARLPGQLEIDRTVPYKTCRLPREAVDEDSAVCLRITGPEEIEYAVAESADAANRGEYTCGPVRISLRE